MGIDGVHNVPQSSSSLSCKPYSGNLPSFFPSFSHSQIDPGRFGLLKDKTLQFTFFPIQLSLFPILMRSLRFHCRDESTFESRTRTQTEQQKSLFCSKVLDWHLAGSGEIQVTLAAQLGQMILTNTSKEVVAETGGRTLLRMLSVSPDAREAALGALLNLSSLEDSGHVLIKAGILDHLLFVMFSLPAPTNLKEKAASTLANLVSVPGNWEGVKVDKEGNTLQSEKVLHKLLGLLLLWDAPWKDRVLQSLYAMAASPLAAGLSHHLNQNMSLFSASNPLALHRPANVFHPISLFWNRETLE